MKLSEKLREMSELTPSQSGHAGMLVAALLAEAYEAEQEKRIAELQDALVECGKKIGGLESQLAWTPVSAGLPTEHGDYEFTYCDSEQVSRLDLVRLGYEGFELVLSGDAFVSEELLDNVDYTHYRKVALP